MQLGFLTNTDSETALNIARNSTFDSKNKGVMPMRNPLKQKIIPNLQGVLGGDSTKSHLQEFDSFLTVQSRNKGRGEVLPKI